MELHISGQDYLKAVYILQMNIWGGKSQKSSMSDISILRNSLLMPVLTPTPPKPKPVKWSIRSAMRLSKNSEDRGKKLARMQIPVISNRTKNEAPNF